MKSGKWYESLCEIHGRQEDKAKWHHKTVAVGRPLTRAMKKFGGCDACRSEANKLKAK